MCGLRKYKTFLKIIQVQNDGLKKKSENVFIFWKIIQVRKYGLRKYYKLFENNKVRKFVLYNLWQCYKWQHLKNTKIWLVSNSFNENQQLFGVAYVRIVCQ